MDVFPAVRDFVFSKVPANFFWHSRVKKNYSLLMKSQWWDHEQLLGYQMNKLARLLDFSYRYVPFYRETFKRLGAVPEDIRTTGSLKSFPVIDKAFVNEHYEEFIPRFHFSNLMKVSTSGSSSQVLSFSWHPDYLHMKSAANHRFESWAGRGWSGRSVKFGSPFFKPEESRLLIKRIYKTNTWLINTGDLSDENLDRIFHALKEIGPDFVSGYPSIIHLVARYMSRRGLNLPKNPKCIMTTSEIIHDEMRETIEQSFHSRVFDWYGLIEGCASAGQCEFGNYHMNMEYNLIEFVEHQGVKKIVGTNLDNLAFPLIRYDTGDVGEFAGHGCPCRRSLPCLKLTGGRITNLIRTGSGYKYFYPSYFNHIIRSHIREFQFIQNSIDRLDLYLVAESCFSDENLREIRSGLAEFLGNDIPLQIHMVDAIKRGPRGKYQAVISNI